LPEKQTGPAQFVSGQVGRSHRAALHMQIVRIPSSGPTATVWKRMIHTLH
jgi:hypothetical protein